MMGALCIVLGLTIGGFVGIVKGSEFTGLVRAKVLFVVDGDTFDVDMGGYLERIRLRVIDAPEKGQPHYAHSRHWLRYFVGRSVYLKSKGRDGYERLLATVYVKIGTRMVNVNALMVKHGFAWVSLTYLHELDAETKRKLIALQQEARLKGYGLWARSNPTPPWQYRYRGRRRNHENRPL